MFALTAAVLSFARRVRIGLLALVLAGASLLLWVPATHAAADSVPVDPGTPPTVTGDVLPTVQIDGVVWAQVTVGNTVYATGSFTTAWPAGKAKGDPGTVTVGNLIAYDITTGVMISSFNHLLDAQGLAIAASPDGSRVYVGGDFTNVDGQARGHIAAFDTATGTLNPNFKPNVYAEVAAVTASNSAVYIGGNYFAVNGVARTRLAAVNAADGALLSWAPTVDDNPVAAMVLSPDQSRVIVGGRFTTISGVNAYGLGAVSTADGSVLPFAANQKVQDYGAQCGILSLSTDGRQIYGTGFAFGCGNFEGTFAADPTTGHLNWAEDCHGDTYGTYATGQVVYTVSHAHDCSAINSFPDTNPRTWHRALAFTTYATGTNSGPDSYGWNYSDTADPSLLHWYPALATGTFTGQTQASWSVTGNGNYIALGGEFPKVNGVAQQGLVRFAMHASAPNKSGPLTIATTTPTAVSVSAGAARISWRATWDTDNTHLTYSVLRDASLTPIYTTTLDSNFWNLPAMGYVDTGVAPGTIHTYRILISDADNNKLATPYSNSVTVSSAPGSTYAGDLVTDGAGTVWRLAESAGTVGYDSVAFNDLVEGSGVTYRAAGPIIGDPATATTFSGSSTGTSGTTTAQPAPATFSIETWIKTTTTRGGKIVGFGKSTTGSSTTSDRHIYMDNAGHLLFGVNNGSAKTVASATTFNDGSYHHIVATLSSAGMALYVDGKNVGRDQTVTTPSSYSGYWRVGGDNLTGWASKPTSAYFAGTIADVAIYPTALTLPQVQQHYTDSGRTLSIAAAPTDGYGNAVYADVPDSFLRLNDTSGTTATDASRNARTGTYTSQGVTKNVAGAFAGSGTAVTFNGSNGNLASSASVTNPQVYSEELWFKTSTTKGGKLIGFGSSQTGTSSNVDRLVYLNNAGNLIFGANPGTQVTVSSAKSYNDNAWHHVVATQGPHGMNLYADGVLVGSNPNTIAQTYNGYWRVAGDKVWSGATSSQLSATIDEVSVYSTELSAARVLAHYNAGGGNVAPTASFTSSCNYTSCSFDAAASDDPDGNLASYIWTFGDGSTASGISPNHLYAAAGDNTVTLTVTDDKGASNTVGKTVSQTGAPAPTASFTPTCTGLSCAFDGTTSSSAAGTVSNWAWNYGDGTVGTGSTSQHAYTVPGSYTATLQITDSFGGKNVATQSVVIVNQAPTAAFTSTCEVLSCSVDGGTSTDPDGTIADYVWDFGDGAAATGVAATHKYAASGTYTVSLTVTDNFGATHVSSQQLTAANLAPVAAFTPTCTALVCAFDGTPSHDADGTIASYSWDFADGATSSAANPSHTFASAGDYTVGLTVTDDLGATNTVSRVIVVRPAANPSTAPYANDTFNRTVTNSLGTADIGGAWTSSGNTANLSVAAGNGKLLMPTAASSPGAYLNAVSSTDTDVTATLSLDKAVNGNGVNLYVIGRRVGLNSEYRGVLHVLATGAVNVGLIKLDGSSNATPLVTESALPGLTYTPGTKLNVRLDVTGTNPTTIRIRVWAAGTTEPTTWFASKTDSSVALQAAGSVGLSSYLAGNATTTPLIQTVSAFQTGPTNTPPSAVATSTCAGLSCTVDGSGSSDVQNNVASYTWNFGDGTTVMATNPSHAFLVDGTFRITLTVTDAAGLTSVATTTVTVSG